MIEKLMKAVKRGNKKRSINITIGAVVGFLLSCTAVMGADEYLWIKNDGGAIKFSTDSNTPSNIENPYGENTWDGVDYVNNITLNSTSTDYGLKLEGDLTGVNFTNNGLIGVTSSSSSYGIYNGSGTKIENIINNGSIEAVKIGDSYDESTGIYNRGTINGNIINNGTIKGNNGIYNSGTISGIIANNGLIFADGREKYGIYSQGTMEVVLNDGLIRGEMYGICNNNVLKKNITNNGSMIGIGGINYYGTTSIINSGLLKGIAKDKTNDGSYSTGGIKGNGEIPKLLNTGWMLGIAIGGSVKGSGIQNISRGEIKNIINCGLITGITTGSGSGYGIYNNSSRYDGPKIGVIKNTGVIYGKTNVIKNADNGAYGGTITSLDNYGILVTEGNEVISNDTYGAITNPPNHYGLQIKNGGASSGDITTAYSGNNFRDDIIVGNDGTTDLKRNMTIKNNTAADGSGSINGDENDSILNALKNTYEVTGTNKVTGSIINAYEEAVVFNTTDKELTLSGTIVNGGIKDNTFAVKGSSGADTLILQAGDITYAGSGSPVSQNTV
ncbi:autotransporter domain-containing protein, partial [Fusobacterium sp. THCT1E2]